mmetsp:Transcript_102043/g.304503  ORF Transcript_102043/g.304503 Transcript_102043/m.304503 type:complete len:269 (-) Transcript_102043:1594-2400(-)
MHLTTPMNRSLPKKKLQRVPTAASSAEVELPRALLRRPGSAHAGVQGEGPLPSGQGRLLVAGEGEQGHGVAPVQDVPWLQHERLLDGVQAVLEVLPGQHSVPGSVARGARHVVQCLREGRIDSQGLLEVEDGILWLLHKPQHQGVVVPDLLLFDGQGAEVPGDGLVEVRFGLQVAPVVEEDLAGVVERQGVAVCGVYVDCPLIGQQGLVVPLLLQVDIGVVELHPRGPQLPLPVRCGDRIRVLPLGHAQCAQPNSASARQEQGQRPSA